MGNYSDSEDNVPPLYSEALIHRPEQFNVIMEMVRSGGGLAVHPNNVGFDYGEHAHLDAERCAYDVAVTLARSNNILCYYDFEQFVVEFLKRNGYFISGFSHLVAIIKSLQEYEYFRTFIASPDALPAVFVNDVTITIINMSTL